MPDMASENGEKLGVFARFRGWLRRIAMEAKEIGVEDPRRIVHSVKVGLAIAVVSLLYYFNFLYQGFGVSAMWAVMTVVVVFEFSVGATLGKGINRGIATFLGGALGVGIHRLASFAGGILECSVLGLSVVLIAAVATFSRFFPKLKARYDYGLVIFILTFSLISVSGYRDDEILDMAHRRLSTILIGGAVTIVVCVFICPIWAGEDLHNITAANIEKLGTFLEGFEGKYFQVQNDNGSLDEYKSVLNSKGIEDSLVNFARWEPRHGKFRYRHPWDQYLKIGSLTRECAYKIDALNGYLKSDVQEPVEIKSKIEEPCTKMSLECSYALRELAMGMRTMTCSFSADSHLINAKASVKKLKALLETGLWSETNLLEIVPAITVASLLIEVVSCTVKIAESVHELASLSRFKVPDLKMIRHISLEKIMRSPSIEGSHNVNIVVE